MRLRNQIAWMLALGLTMFAAATRAEDPPTDKGTASDNPAAPDKAPASQEQYAIDSATVERIMDTAVRNIARRYNLNEAQTEKTDELMKREVRRFLKEHENEVWPAIRSLLAAQFGARPPDDPGDTKRLGALARPLAKLAKDAIFDANKEWRTYLTAEQKQMHDFDMAEMEKTFTQIDKHFESWEKGDPMKGRIFPDAPSADTGPPRPPRPKGKEIPPAKDRFIALNILDTLVEGFIEDYELDEAQITAARSILTEFKGKATDFKNAQKEEFAKIDAERDKALKRRDREAIKQTTAAHKKLLEPFYALVKQMEERLKGLLTTAQIERHAERSKKPEAPKTEVKTATTEAPPKTAGGTKPRLDRADSQARKQRD